MYVVLKVPEPSLLNAHSISYVSFIHFPISFLSHVFPVNDVHISAVYMLLLTSVSTVNIPYPGAVVKIIISGTSILTIFEPPLFATFFILSFNLFRNSSLRYRTDFSWDR